MSENLFSKIGEADLLAGESQPITCKELEEGTIWAGSPFQFVKPLFQKICQVNTEVGDN